MTTMRERPLERHSYPSTRRAIRELKLGQARSHLRGYVAAVRAPLLDAGFSFPSSPAIRSGSCAGQHGDLARNTPDSYCASMRSASSVSPKESCRLNTPRGRSAT